MHRRAFTLVELLTVIAIIAVLSAILLPVFLKVRGSARSTSCRSNLRQIGVSTALYTQDWDSLYPFGIDQNDRYIASAWSTEPKFKAQIPNLPFVKDLLQPYLKSRQIFVCPSDTGYDYDDFNLQPISGRPSGAEAYGSSYIYNTALAVYGAKVGLEEIANRTNHSFGGKVLFCDSAGDWHGTLIPIQRRYNVLFTDLHVKNISAGELAELREGELLANSQ